MKRTKAISFAALGLVAIAGVALADNPPKHQVPTSPNGDLVVGLCDGTTSAEVKGVKNGQDLTPTQAQQVSDDLMKQWKAKNPAVGAEWEKEQRLARNSAPPPAPAPPPTSLVPQTQSGHTYGGFTTRDEQLWRASTQAFVDKGNAIFHDAKAMGGTIAVSCDMCHPNAANTHPETYPKFQVQLGKVAMLRDMINWCIENPVRGKPLADDDPRLKAMEAYIYAQRKGVALEYGKH